MQQAIGYWQRAGQQALQRSANPEAVQHLTTGLALLATLPETPARAQQELDLQIALGPALMATKGPAAPEVEQTYARALALCQQVGETPQLFPTLWGLCRFYRTRGALPTARELGEQLYRLAQRAAAPTPSWRPMTRSGTPCSTWANTPPPGRTSSRGSPSPTRRRSGPWCSAMTWRLG